MPKLLKKYTWWAVYRCPACGYETCVTDICRSCSRNMYATGMEEHGDVKRPMTVDSEQYDIARLKSNMAMVCDRLEGRKPPDWAWFGIET